MAWPSWLVVAIEMLRRRRGRLILAAVDAGVGALIVEDVVKAEPVHSHTWQGES